jgi:hypothetical protein
MKISRAALTQIIEEETQKILTEADTRFLTAAERRELRRARRAKGAELTRAEREEISALHLPRPAGDDDDSSRIPSIATLGDRFAKKTRPGPGGYKPVEDEHKPLFRAYKDLYFKMLDLTNDQRAWLAGVGVEGGTGGFIPREVLKRYVPEILAGIDAIKNNEIDPDLQARLSDNQSGPVGETEQAREARIYRYESAVRDYHRWHDKPYRDLEQWLRTREGKPIAKKYRAGYKYGSGETQGPDAWDPNEAETFKKQLADRTKLEQDLLALGYDEKQLQYYVTDPDKIYPKG